MTTKKILCKRLGTAVGCDVTDKFTWFFGYFCEKTQREELRNKQQLSEKDVEQFSQFCGYDLKFPIPLPILAKF